MNDKLKHVVAEHYVEEEGSPESSGAIAKEAV